MNTTTLSQDSTSPNVKNKTYDLMLDCEAQRREKWLSDIRKYGEDCLSRIDEDLRRDRAFFAQATRGNWYGIKYAAPELMRDSDYVLRARLPLLADGHASVKSMPYRVDESYLRRASGSAFDQRFFENLQDEEGFITKIQLMDAVPQKATTKKEKRILLERVSAGASGWLSVGQHDVLADSQFMTSVRSRLAHNYRQLSKKEKEEQKYTGYGALNVSLDAGGVVLIDANWLLEYVREGDGARGQGLPRRQDLPSTAIYTGPVFELTIVLSLSYCWTSGNHPDLYGNQLIKVAPLIEWFVKTHQGKRTLIFWDWCSLPQHSNAITPCEVVKDDGKDFIQVKRTWGAADVVRVPRWLIKGHEKDKHMLRCGTRLDVRFPRTSREDKLYKAGLADCYLWYSNVQIYKLFLRHLPPEVKELRPGYDASGWPIFEKHVAHLTTDGYNIFDVDTLGSVELSTISDTSALAAADKVERRFLPLTPVDFEAEITGNGDNKPPKFFSCEDDAKFLIKKYRIVYGEIMGMRKEMSFRDMPHIESREWVRLFNDILPSCYNLLHLDLRNNDAIELDVKYFSQEDTNIFLNKLKTLILTNNTNMFGDILAFASLRKLQHLDVQGMTLLNGDVGKAFGNNVELKTLVLAGCDRITGNILELNRLNLLVTLDIDGCHGLRGPYLSYKIGNLGTALPACKIYYMGVTESHRRDLAQLSVKRPPKVDDDIRGEGFISKRIESPRNSDGSTALMLAAEEGNADLVQLLLENDADPFAKDNKNRTAFDYASSVLDKMEKEALQVQKKLHLDMQSTGKKKETLSLQLALSRAAVAADASMKGHRGCITNIMKTMQKMKSTAEQSRKLNGVRGYAPVLRRRPGEVLPRRQPGDFQLKSHRLTPGDTSDWEGIMEHIDVFDHALNIRENEVRKRQRPATSFASFSGGRNRGLSRQRNGPRDAKVLEVMRVQLLEEAARAEDRNKALSRAAALALTGYMENEESQLEESRLIKHLQPSSDSRVLKMSLASRPQSISSTRIHRQTHAKKEIKEFLRTTALPKDPGLTRLIKMRHQGFSGPVSWKTGDSESIFLAGHVPKKAK